MICVDMILRYHIPIFILFIISVTKIHILMLSDYESFIRYEKSDLKRIVSSMNWP